MDPYSVVLNQEYSHQCAHLILKVIPHSLLCVIFLILFTTTKKAGVMDGRQSWRMYDADSNYFSCANVMVLL